MSQNPDSNIHREADQLAKLKSQIGAANKILPPKRLTAEPEYLRCVIADEVSVVASFASVLEEQPERAASVSLLDGEADAMHACNGLVKNIDEFVQKFDAELDNILPLRERLGFLREAALKYEYNKIYALAKLCLGVVVEFNFLRAIQKKFEFDVTAIPMAGKMSDPEGFVRDRCHTTRTAVHDCLERFAPEISCIDGLQEFLAKLLEFAALGKGNELHQLYLDERERFFNT